MTRKTLKLNAKSAMKDALVSPYVVTMIFGIITFVMTIGQTFLDFWERIAVDSGEMRNFTISNIIFYIIFFILSTIIQFGYYKYCLKVANRDDTMSYGDLFSTASYLLKALWLSIVISFFTLLWSLLLIVPGIIAAYRYSQAIFIFVENPDKGVIQCIRESKEMMAGHKWEYFVLELSFILWFLLGIVTCFLAYLYVYPYMTVTLANFYNQIKPKPVDYEAIQYNENMEYN